MRTGTNVSERLLTFRNRVTHSRRSKASRHPRGERRGLSCVPLKGHRLTS